MGRNATLATAGTRFYYKPDVDQAISPADKGTQIRVSKYGALPGGNDISEYETYRADQVKDDETPDLVMQTAPSLVDPGAAEITVAGEAQVAAVMELKGTYGTFMYLFSSGGYATFNGWFQKTGMALGEKNEMTCDVKIRATSELVYHPAP